MSIDLDHVLSRNAPKDGTPPEIVEPGDPYPYLYVELPDENAVVMAIGTVGFDPEWGEERPPPEPSVITSVAPTEVSAGVATPMTVTGTGFHDGDVVYQDEGMMPTTFVSDTTLTFTAQADLPGDIDIDVRGIGGTSNSISIPVIEPVEDESAE